MASVSGLVAAARQPAYTGENRCIPCTIVNIALAVLLAAAVGLLIPLGTTLSLAASVGILGISAVAIYLRGYLVPGTPQLTKAYLPDAVLAYFDHHSTSTDTDSADRDVEQLLVQSGVVTECETRDDLCLSDEFRTAWRHRIADRREADTTRKDLAAILDVDPDRLTVREHWEGEAFVALLDDVKIGQWESRAALLADVTAAAVLETRYPEWERLDVESRSSMLSGLRLFIEQCPTCDGPIRIGEEVVSSCCRSIDVVAVTCEACDARLFEAETQAIA